MPQQANPWFDPNSPITTFGSGAQNVMQGMYASAMLKQQQDELARQFNAQQALEGRKQDWTETNTPAFQFGQMTDVTRDRFGEVPIDEVQENYFKQFKPYQEPTLDEQAAQMVKSGGASDMADAYDKLQKVGRYNIYNTPSKASQPSADLVKYQDGMRRYQAGEFGPVGSEEAMAKFQAFVQTVSTRPTVNFTPRPMLGEHKAIIGSAAKNVAGTLKAIDEELKSIASKPELFDKEGNPLPMEGAQPTGGFLGIGKTTKQWPTLWAGKFKLLKEHRVKMATAMQFVQFLQDMAEGGSAFPPNVVNWINKINNTPTSILEDDAILQAIPALQKEIEQSGSTDIVR